MGLALKAEDKQIVYGEVYAPNRPDAQGEYMVESQIESMAHKFMKDGMQDQIDVMHNNQVVSGARVVESFIARKGDDTFVPGSWVVGVYIPDGALWNDIRSGKLNGFSMEALVTRHKQQVYLEAPPLVRGLTSKSEDHTHEFYVTYDNDGNFKGGVTNTVNGHFHPIQHGTHTATVNGHNHRFSAVDDVTVVGD